MLRNYLKTALRNLRRHPGYTAINLLGLALGLTVVLQIFLFVQHELGYDAFHERSEDIYRVTIDGSFSGTELSAPVTPAPMTAALVSDFPEVETGTRIFPFANEQMIRKGDVNILEDGFLIVDSTFFDVFSFDLLQGDPRTALTRPNTVVLTRTLATKLFDREDPLGQSVQIGDTTRFEVTGIVADPPDNSHIQFDILRTTVGVPFAQQQFWVSNNWFSYIRLAPGTDAAALEAKLPEFFKGYAGPQIAQAFGKSYDEVMTGDNAINYHLQRIRDFHLRSNFEIDLQPSGDITYVYLFIAVAVFILLLACINFMNLSTARSATRAMEVGIRKVVGSGRTQLVAQFLSESTVMSVTAMIIAVGLVFLTIPYFNAIMDQSLSAGILLQPAILGILVAGALVVGLLAGSYPALFLSGFKPVSVIKAQSATGRGKSLLRNTLVVFQFTISVGLLVGTLIVRDQLNYIQNKRLGFDKEYAIVVERAGQLGDQRNAFKDRLRSYSGVRSVGATSALPGTIHGSTGFRPEGFALEDMILMSPIGVDYDYIEAMGIEMAEGRDFSRDFPSDSAAYVINEAALREIGWDSAVGKTMGTFSGQSVSDVVDGPIIGVVKDYHYASLRNKIGAVALLLRDVPLPYIIVRTTGENLNSTLDYVQTAWDEFVPEQPFEYTFLDDNFFKLFDGDRRLGRLFSSFSIFAIFIAGLGLFGLGLFVTEQRTREIGIRKAMGASVSQILVLLSRDFTQLVLISMLLAFPLAYFGMEKWMQGFVYRTGIHVMTFVLAGVLAICIAWLTVAYQSIKAATSDPVEALHYE
jgi:putative ABC transport system permease protein